MSTLCHQQLWGPGGSSCPVTGAQPNVPGDLGVFIPGRWAQLLLSHLQVQPVARLCVHPGDACLCACTHTYTHSWHWHCQLHRPPHTRLCLWQHPCITLAGLTQSIKYRHLSILLPLWLVEGWSSVVKALTQHTLDSQAHARSWMPWVPAQPLCPSATPALLTSLPSLRFVRELNTHLQAHQV